MNENHNFVGREAEIALFNKCLEAIWYENQNKVEYKGLPKILSFYGEAGIGKTSLAEHFAKITKQSSNMTRIFLYVFL